MNANLGVYEFKKSSLLHHPLIFVNWLNLNLSTIFFCLITSWRVKQPLRTSLSGEWTPLSWSFTQRDFTAWETFPAAGSCFSAASRPAGELCRSEKAVSGQNDARPHIPFLSARTQESAEVRRQIHFRKRAAIVLRKSRTLGLTPCQRARAFFGSKPSVPFCSFA